MLTLSTLLGYMVNDDHEILIGMDTLGVNNFIDATNGLSDDCLSQIGDLPIASFNIYDKIIDVTISRKTTDDEQAFLKYCS